MSLSPRGRAAEKASDGLHIWKAVGDLYHPTTNPTGFATLGVSENTLMAQELSEHLHKHFKRLAERYQFVVHWANTHGVPYARGTNAAFFLWADLGSVWKKHNPGALNEDLDDFLTKLFLDHKVYISSGKDFGPEQPGWFRIVFSQDEVQLKTSLERVAAALRPIGNC